MFLRKPMKKIKVTQNITWHFFLLFFYQSNKRSTQTEVFDLEEIWYFPFRLLI